MVFVNEAMTWETKPVSVLRDFLILLQPFAPHLAEELWAKLNIVLPQSVVRTSRHSTVLWLMRPGLNSIPRCWSNLKWKFRYR